MRGSPILRARVGRWFWPLLLLIAASCATGTGTGTPRQDEPAGDIGGEVRFPLSPLSPVAAVEEGSRLSLGGLVTAMPEGWSFSRVEAGAHSVTGVLTGENGETVVLGAFDAGSRITTDAFISFFLEEMLAVEGVPPGAYLQTLREGDFYAGIPLGEGEVLRLRGLRNGDTIHYAAARLGEEAADAPGLEEILSGLRLSRRGESSYRVTSEGLTVVETRDSPWILMEESQGRITLAALDPGAALLIELTLLPEAGFPGAPRLRREVWIGLDRYAFTGNRRVTEAQIEERYLAPFGSGTLEVTITGAPREGGETSELAAALDGESLLDSPAATLLFEENLWLEVKE